MTDRDKLVKLIENADKDCQCTTDCTNCGGYGKGKSCTYYHLADYLLANKVKIEKQGEWKQTKEPLGWQEVDCVECSVCGESWIVDEELSFEEQIFGWNYCMNCGAKMKEREGNGLEKC